MKQPALCPICTGSGIVPGGFYNRTSNTWSHSEVSELCRACKGKGYILIEQDEIISNTAKPMTLTALYSPIKYYYYE